MSLYDAIAAASLGPAHTFAIDDEIGRAVPGAPANLTVFEVAEHALGVQDSDGHGWTIERLVLPRWAIVRGVAHAATRGAHGMNLPAEGTA